MEWKLKSGERVVDRHRSHLHESVVPLLPAALAQIDSNGRNYFVEGVDFDQPIGETICVATGPGDEIVYAQRPNRAGLTRFVENGQLPIDNNWIENQIRPIAIGRNNWLFAGSLRAGQRAAAVMSLIQSAKLNGHDPYAYLKDVLTRLPTQLNSQIEELLPHRWRPQGQ